MSQKKGGVILAYISQVVSILTGILYTPYMLRALGQAEYGLYSLVSSTVSVLGMLNLGFSGCYLYFYNKYSAEQDEAAVGRFNATYFLIFCVISILTLVCGGFILFNMRLFFGDGLSSEEYKKASLLIIVMVLNMAASLPCNVFSSGVNANGKFIFEQAYTLVSGLLTSVVNVIVLAFGGGSLGLVIVALIFTCVKFIIFAYIGIRKLQMIFCFSGLQLALVKTMFSFTFFIFLNQVINYINGQVDKVLLGRFAGTTVVAIYSVGSSLNSYYQQFGSSVASVFGPQINEIVAKSRVHNDELGGNALLTDIFIKVSRIQVFILMLVLTGFLLVGKTFVNLWAGEGYSESFYIAAVLMVGGSVAYFQSLGDSIQRAKFKHQIRSIVFLCMAILNVCISIPLIKVAGALGAAIGTMIVWIIGDWFFLNWYYSRKLDLEMGRYWKNILSIFKRIIPVFLCGALISHIVTIDDWGELAVFVVVYSGVYCLVCWKFVMNSEEKQMVLNMLPLKVKIK